ncbi:MAG TPA: hypothetical protein VGA13_13355 [Acidimicrobiales bacterium]
MLQTELALTVTGSVAVAGAWLGTSTVATPAAQMGWVVVAASGVLVSAAGHTLTFVAARRAISTRRRAIAERIDALLIPERPHPTTAASQPAMGPLVVAAAQRLAHLSDCPLVAGKAVRTVSDPTSRPSCPVCSRTLAP